MRADTTQKLLFIASLIAPCDVAAVLEVEVNRVLDGAELHRLVGKALRRWLLEDDVGRRICEAYSPQLTIGHVLAEASENELDSLRPWFRSVGISRFEFTVLDHIGDYDQDLLNPA